MDPNEDKDRLSEEDLDEAAGGYGSESGEDAAPADGETTDPATRTTTPAEPED